MKNFFKELGLKQDEYMVYCDSQSAIDLNKNATYHSRAKRIEVRYHWIRDATEMKRFQLKKIHTCKNGAYMMTKVIPKQKVEFCSKLAGMNPITDLGDFPHFGVEWVWRGRFDRIHPHLIFF